MIWRNNGDVLVFGSNLYGQLGLGDNQNRNKPELLMTDPEIKQIICGGHHTMIWRNNGDVLVFGYNEEGQLGLGDNQNRNKPVFLMNNINLKMMNNTILKKVPWQKENYHKILKTTKSRIFLFMLIRYRFFKQYSLHLVPNMRDYIIDFLI